MKLQEVGRDKFRQAHVQNMAKWFRARDWCKRKKILRAR